MTNHSIAIVGFGSQARAWALNLKDSKVDFKIALKPNSKSLEKVKNLGMKSISLESNELSIFKTFLILIPDDQHLDFFVKNSPYFSLDSHFVYAHGFSLSKFELNKKYPQFRHSLLAPKAIASEVRFQYETHGKIGAIYFTDTQGSEQEILDLAKKVGFTALYKAHYDEETIADLFSEQSLLCSILPYAALKSFNLLIEKGIPTELAFMECFLELRSISNAFVSMGPEAFFKLISPNALIGSEKGKDLILDKHFDEALNKIYLEIKNKEFYKQVEQNPEEIRNTITERWQKEFLSKTFQQLKADLI
jgi:ketol-acid reductoisomerase